MNIVILGAGESGLGAALLAQQKGYTVFVSDFGAIAPNYKTELEENNIPYEEKQHTTERILKAGEVIKSPGIPDTVPIMMRIKAEGIPVIAEVEFAFRFINDAKVIAITGSNGKTTTTNLTYHLLHTAGLDVAMGGNVGYSFARLLTQKRSAYYVLELSSFQLDGIINFRPEVAMLLNITPDHLDRYDYQMEKYIASKFRITLNQKATDLFIYNSEDQRIVDFMATNRVVAQPLPVGAESYNAPYLQVTEALRIDLRNCSLKGPHNRFNARCAIKVAKHYGVSDTLIQTALESFVSVPHRMEMVRELDGISYINDSKATNVDAVYFALKAMEKPIVMIMGGQDKGNDYESLLALVEEKVKVMICLGLDNTKLLANFSPLVEIIVETQDVEEAVHLAKRYATAGDVVLLSPACASFDLFKNFAARGDQFKAAVNAL